MIVASEKGSIDGRLTVLESWYGDAKPGQQVEVPELAEFKPPSSRQIIDRLTFEKSGQVTADRIVLFLSNVEGRWEPAAGRSWIKVSAVWIEEDRLFGFLQLVNPGGLRLVALQQTEPELRAEVLSILQARQELTRIHQRGPSGTRAVSASKYLRHEAYRVRAAALEALVSCGEEAVPHLRQLLRDGSQPDLHGDAIEALSLVGGTSVGPDLVAIVARETPFWRDTAPFLKIGWWNGKGLRDEFAVEYLQYHYVVTYEALNGLRRIEYTEAEEAVRTLKDTWESYPPLKDLEQMIEMCEKLLKGS